MGAPSGYWPLCNTGYIDRGGFEENTQYYKNNVVHYYGFPYICIRDRARRVFPTDKQVWKPMIAPEEEED